MQSATATLALVDGLQDVLRSVDTNVRYLARDLEDRELNPAEVDRIIHNVMAGTPDFREFSISFEPQALSPGLERFGHYLYRSGDHILSRDLAAPAYRYWTKDWYNDALSHGDVTWSEPFFDQGGANASVVRISAPFYRTENGHRVAAGVVSAGLELRWVRRLTEENPFSDSGYVIIFSPEGRVIAHPNPNYVFTETMESLAQKSGTPELEKIHQRVRAGRQGALSYFSNTFHHRVHESYKPVAVGGWGVIVGYDENEFLKPVRYFRWTTIGTLAATLALLSIIVLLATRVALRPLATLAETSQEISRGNLDHEIIPPRRPDEIGQLTKAFLLMQTTLKHNRALETSVRERTAEVAAANEMLKGQILERRWVNQALEHQLRYDQLIVNSISDLVFVVTKSVNISRINPAVVKLTGWEATDLVNTPLARLVRLEAGASKGDSLAQALSAGHDVRDQPAEIEDRHGGRIGVRLTLFPLRDRDKVVGGVVILRALSA
jgi:sigma-B regulation protein RsbU (phosphoserine phosphatase)